MLDEIKDPGNLLEEADHDQGVSPPIPMVDNDWLRVLPDGVEKIPAYSMLEPYGFDIPKLAIKVRQPTDNSIKTALLNGPVALLGGVVGHIRKGWPKEVTFDSTKGNPKVNDGLGTITGSYEGSSNNAGFLIHAIDDTRVYVSPASGTSTPGSSLPPLAVDGVLGDNEGNSIAIPIGKVVKEVRYSIVNTNTQTVTVIDFITDCLRI